MSKAHANRSRWRSLAQHHGGSAIYQHSEEARWISGQEICANGGAKI